MQWFKDYLVSPTHKWWVDNVWRPSWTKFLSFIYGIPALAVTAWQGIAAWGNSDTVSTYLSKLDVPNWVPVSLTVVALSYYIAHGRAASEST